MIHGAPFLYLVPPFGVLWICIKCIMKFIECFIQQKKIRFALFFSIKIILKRLLLRIIFVPLSQRKQLEAFLEGKLKRYFIQKLK